MFWFKLSCTCWIIYSKSIPSGRPKLLWVSETMCTQEIGSKSLLIQSTNINWRKKLKNNDSSLAEAHIFLQDKYISKQLNKKNGNGTSVSLENFSGSIWLSLFFVVVLPHPLLHLTFTLTGSLHPLLIYPDCPNNDC